MIDPAVLDAMLAAGASAEVIVAAVKADQAGEEARRQEKREKDAERQRRSRASRNVTVTACDTADGTPSLDKETLPPTPPIKEINPTPAHTHETRAREAFPRPEWAEPGVWSDFLANRRRKRLSNTATAHRKLLTDIDRLTDDHWPPGRVLEAATARGWGAIYDGLKDDDDGRRNGQHGMAGHRGGSRSGLGVTVDAALGFIADVRGQSPG